MNAPRTIYAVIRERYGNPAAFVTELKARLEEHRISQGALARRLGCGPEHISRWLGESRRVTPSLETMIMLDEAADQLIHGAI